MHDFADRLEALLSSRHRPTPDPSVEKRVRDIVSAVQTQGDPALVALTNELDRCDVRSMSDLVVDRDERRRAMKDVGAQTIEDLELAAKRIEAFHRRQQESSWSIETPDGVRLAQRLVPLRRVGVYVPGGTAAYPSSVLMNVVPARVAGVEDIVMVTPTPDGVISPAVLAAAEIAGVDQLIRIGGAQAIAALAYGTATVPRVDKIVGPGNQWVATAKRQVFGVVDIDMIAGPSELCVVATADGGASPAQLAADLLSQAEHDPLAMVTFISPDAALIERVREAIQTQLVTLPRQAIAQEAIANHSCTIAVESVAEALSIAEQIAPEHLELVIPDAEAHAELLRNAGAIFCGPHTPEAIGDYIAGPNHVLPTNGTARFSSALGVYDFVKRVNLIRFSEKALQSLGPATIRLAELEGLSGHAESVRKRLKPRE